MSLFTVICFAVAFVTFGLFVALRLCSSDKSEPEVRQRAEKPTTGGVGHRA
ncbi:hypothetical protein [Salinicola rhizosphaerae]|uniref:hypothetical protein n=1 Tax=Salinicola rhizosphaerae TaxID=1443141 RepID=UPI00167258FC|nr:hypothetical protein [Salinicola rhizosphaerae]